MALLTVTTLAPGGAVKPALVAVDAGLSDTFFNDGKTVMEVNNGSGADLDVTISGVRTLKGGISADKTITISNGATQRIGPFPCGIYNADTTQLVTVTWETDTSVTVGLLSCNNAESN